MPHTVCGIQYAHIFSRHDLSLMEPVYEPFLMILKLKTDQESLGKIVANEIFLITVHA